jgi:hypothetical protein
MPPATLRKYAFVRSIQLSSRQIRQRLRGLPLRLLYGTRPRGLADEVGVVRLGKFGEVFRIDSGIVCHCSYCLIRFKQPREEVTSAGIPVRWLHLALEPELP